jgi:hypothetical protein
MLDNAEIEQYVKGRLEAHRDSEVAHDLGEELPFCADRGYGGCGKPHLP